MPESVMEAVNRTLKNVEDVRTHFPDFLNQCTPTYLAQLDPLERAQSLLLLAKATTVLFACMFIFLAFFFFYGFFLYCLIYMN